MPREIPRSRRYVTVLLPRDRDLIFRIGHNLGRSVLLSTSNITYRLNSFRLLSVVSQWEMFVECQRVRNDNILLLFMEMR